MSVNTHHETENFVPPNAPPFRENVLNRMHSNCHYWTTRVASLLVAVVLMPLTVNTVAAEADPFQKTLAPNFKKFCIQCHGEGDYIEGKTNLLELDQQKLFADAEMIRRLTHVLDAKEMPPEDEDQPDEKVRQKMISDLKAMLHEAVAKKGSFAQAPIRRMNRFQYNNAVTDLFDLKCIVFTLPERMMRVHKDYFRPETGKMANVVSVGNRPLGKSQMIEPRLAGVAAFPQDLRAEHGYDNRADHLSMSPLLMESFLKLGQSITNSKDFGPRNVGIWKEFFVAPTNLENVESEVRSRLKPFLTKAFRKPIEKSVLDRYVGYAARKVEAGGDWTETMKSVAAATLASPRFLYLYDHAADKMTSEQIDDFELASRLSFFLWGSVPDQTLLELAVNGELKKPDVLKSQVDRMLKDRKLKRFCDSFPAQWLQLDRLISSVPNREKFPQFYFSKYRDSMHMMMEPLLLFETVLIENQPITKLIDPDFTYRSPLLEDAYGELRSKVAKPGQRGGGVTVLTFQRVPITDRRAGGVITNAAVMTMTSGPERTQPITRGAWIATVIFNNPPEPPPADVPPLAEKPSADQVNLTLRERLALHRERADCKGCHEKIDPLGFALENYDPVGAWRSQYENGRDIDPSGRILGKHNFADVVEFKDAILAEKDRFTHALAGHLLSFALARELTAVDQIALEKIVEATAADDDKIQTLIKQVVLSKPFQSKTNPKQSLTAAEKRSRK